MKLFFFTPLLVGGLLAMFSSLSYADIFDDEAKKIDQAFNTEKQKQDAAYANYSAEIDHAWQRYSTEINAMWGADGKLPSKKEWVVYSKQRDARSSINFEKGTLEIDLLIDPNKSAQSAKVKERIAQQLEKAITQPAQEDEAVKVNPPSDIVNDKEITPIYPLKNQLTRSNGSIVTSANAASFSKEIIQKKSLKSKVIDTPKGKRKMVSISISLIPNHLQNRVKPYLTRIKDMAHHFGIPPSLILGIMQTESYFNPMAHSGVPAYGLMQLVPRSGGRDAYVYVFKNDKIVSASYLYDPINNIQLGSAYLKLLQVREMRRIKDDKTRMLCAIAAYNTGGGNVAKAFIPGSHNIRKASKLINTMTYEEVYDHLRTHLPYEETQNYIVKVTKYMKNYTALDGN